MHLCCVIFHCHFSFEYHMPCGNMVTLSFHDISWVLDGVAVFLFLSSFTTSRLDPENTLYMLITEEEWNPGPNEVSDKTPVDFSEDRISPHLVLACLKKEKRPDPKPIVVNGEIPSDFNGPVLGPVWGYSVTSKFYRNIALVFTSPRTNKLSLSLINFYTFLLMKHLGVLWSSFLYFSFLWCLFSDTVLPCGDSKSLQNKSTLDNDQDV